MSNFNLIKTFAGVALALNLAALLQVSAYPQKHVAVNFDSIPIIDDSPLKLTFDIDVHQVVAPNNNDNSTFLLYQFDTMCLREINVYRAQYNVRPLLLGHPKIEEAAKTHNFHMMTNNCLSHRCPDEPGLGDRVSATGYRWGLLGETLGLGYRDCRHFTEGLMLSEPHRNILIGKAFVHVGCSGLTCDDCPRKGPWWTCVFAAPVN